MELFFRNLRLKSFFSGPQVTDTARSFSNETNKTQLILKEVGLQNRNSFTPLTTDVVVESYIKLVKNYINKLKSRLKIKPFLGVRPNLNKKDRMQLEMLLTHKDLIFKAADKGGALVVLDKGYDVTDILTELMDTNVSLKLTSDPLKNI
ncbi:hypothetical protein XELAEV_18012389mg [Xenopus laevis]|uniref:Uncharacterized protein n=1 Tax=Xenopus laevis TaxID=8355 RepID=A0A974DN09_XENLA|nr:hypothetical protein XELAEV_18012389mg [Xenopus laevis]